MAHRCDFCGAVLDDEEEERSELIGKDTCDDCLNHGLQLLREILPERED